MSDSSNRRKEPANAMRTGVVIAVLAVMTGLMDLATADEARTKAGAPDSRPASSALAGLDTDFKALARYEWGQPDAALKSIDTAVASVLTKPFARRDLEARLSQLLKGAATQAAKHYACRKLALIGAQQCVPAVAPLLTDKDLSHMARTALEQNPAPAATAALCDALPTVRGVLKVGVINSLGVRRDAASAATLTAALGDPDRKVAAAAACALARIGTADAVRAVFEFQAKAPAEIRLAVTVACLDGAENLAKAGAKDEAARRFEELMARTEPAWVRIAAFRGLVAVTPEQAASRVMKSLNGDDALWRATAGEAIRGMRDLKPYADAFGGLTPAAQAVVLDILGQRKHPAARGVTMAALGNRDESVRAAALEVLGSVGTVEDVPRLVEAVAKAGPARDAALRALTRTKTPRANRAMVAAMSKTPAAKPAVLGVLAARRAAGEMPAVLSCAEDSVADVRSAAVAALGELGNGRQVADLVRIVQKTPSPDERSGMEKALLAICGRARAACARDLMPLAGSADSGLRRIALHAMAAAGGGNALAALRSALGDPEESVQDEAVRVLSTWPNQWPEDAGVAEPLLALARSGRKASHRVLALRGYLQYVQADGRLRDDEKVAKVREVLSLMTRPEEKRLAIAAIGAVPTAGALDILAAFAADPALAEEACSAMVNLAGRSDLKDVSKQQRQKSLQMVLEKSKAEATKNRAQQTLKTLP